MASLKMQRRDFIKNFIGVYGLSNLPVEMIKEYTKVYLLQFFVRGFQYYKGPEIIDEINKKGLVDLKREPDNMYDKHAIAVYFENKKIGYIPRESNYVLSKLMDAKLLDLQAEITHIKKEAQTWEQIRVAVYALKEKTEKIPEELTKIKEPQYYTLNWKNDTYHRVYFDEKNMIDDEKFYQKLVENSSTDDVYDLIHNSFQDSEELKKAVSENRFLIRKDSKTIEILDELAEKIDNVKLEIDNMFDEVSYVVADLEKIAEIPDKILFFEKIINKAGDVFYEVVFR